MDEQTTLRAMRKRDFQLMEQDSATPLESGRVTALADRCDLEGLRNCATTLRGLLAEVSRLRAALEEVADEDPADPTFGARYYVNLARKALGMEPV